MSDRPRVSVIIPVYGTEEWVRKTIDCVLSQTISDVEVICVDDCSPDGSGAIIDEAAASDVRVKAIHLPENHGQGYARYVALEVARGTYVYFLDSDDLCEPNTLELCASTCDHDMLDGVFFDARSISDDPELMRLYGGNIAPASGEYPAGVATGTELFDAFVTQREWVCYPQRQFWRRAFLIDEGLRFPDASAHEDELFAHEAFLTARRMRYLREQLFLRRWRAGSVMTTPPNERGFYSYFIGYLGMIRFNREHAVTTYSATINAARIYDRLVQQYAVIGEERLAPWFTKPDERLLFEFFVETQKVDLGYFAAGLGPAAAKLASEAGRVFVYGAGVVGRRVVKSLAVCETPIDGVIVTSAEGNPPSLLGHRITTLEALGTPREGDLVVVAVSARYRDEVERTLDDAGWRHVYYLDRLS